MGKGLQSLILSRKRIRGFLGWVVIAFLHNLGSLMMVVMIIMGMRVIN
jgi:hypothetical protein